MAMKNYQIKGRFLMGDRMQPFTKECSALSEKRALEYIFSELGSKHRTPRDKIRVEEVKELEG